MHIRTAAHLLIAIALTAILAACGSGKPPDTSSVTQFLALPADKHAEQASGASPPAGSASVAGTPIPATTDEIWMALDKQSYALQKAVDGGAWKDAQTKADAIGDLIAALPAHASKLSADEQTRLQQKIALVANYLQKLKVAAGSGDAAAVKDNYKKLNDTLGGITRFP